MIVPAIPLVPGEASGPVLALSEPLRLAPGFTPDQLRAAMEGRMLASGSLTATYRRGG